eukprot:6566087-Ditylum_brightwellii.AAC.1
MIASHMQQMLTHHKPPSKLYKLPIMQWCRQAILTENWMNGTTMPPQTRHGRTIKIFFADKYNKLMQMQDITAAAR